jgi:hypothetical protein
MTLEQFVELGGLSALVLLALWYALRARFAFVVRVRGGEPAALRGTVTPAFLACVRDVCAEFGVASATVRGAIRGRRISLDFSREMPPAAQQRLRNWWAASGWPWRPGPEGGPSRAAA